MNQMVYTMPSIKSADGSYTLYYSADSGEANLTVGFYLTGPPDIIKYLKEWDFGDGKQEKDHDLVKNHLYGPRSPPSCPVSVTVLDPVSEKPITQAITFTIHVGNHQANPSYIAKFYQTEGVIFQGTAAGCSISVPGIAPDNIVWMWEDGGQPTSGKSETNPWNTYNDIYKDPPANGLVTVYGPAGQDVWKFYVMVLQDPRTVVGGTIDIVPNVWPYVNQELTFLANLSSQQDPQDGYGYRYQWSFETNPTNTSFDGRDKEGPIDWSNLQQYTTARSFGTSENYRVIFTIYRVVDGKNNPYLSLSRSFNIRPRS